MRRRSLSADHGLSRRTLLVGGGAGIGLIVAWGLWPRDFRPNLATAPGETALGAYLKIGVDGRVIVACPQVEMGQGVYTSMPQIVADELGADWRTVGVEAAPIGPLYANRLLAEEWAAAFLPRAGAMAGEWARRHVLMASMGSTAVRGYEEPLRLAGATAGALLTMAAAARWDVPWEEAETGGGFVVHDGKRLRFGELAAEAAALTPPALPPLRVETEGRLTGVSVPRLDLPSKVDGSALYAGDVRLPRMVFASVRAAPVNGVLHAVDRDAARAVRGVVALIEQPGWVAAVGTNWWAADRALVALNPRFATDGRLADDATVAADLLRALEEGGERVVSRGDPDGAFDGAQAFGASYGAAPALHAAVEPMTATANWDGERLELWLSTQAPAAARRDAAAAAELAEHQVVVFPMMLGGGFGRKLESEAACQAAVLAVNLRRPVQLTWSRVEDLAQDRPRAPAEVRMRARLGPRGRIEGWRAHIAAPAAGRQVARRIVGGGAVSGLIGDGPDATMVDGLAPPYAIPNVALVHHAADIGVPVGDWRGGAASIGCFAAESFVDELAAAAGVDPFSYRIAMLGGAPRLARCLSTVAAIAGWQGGGAGTAQGLACFSGWGSHIAVAAEARIAGGTVEIVRLSAVADVGRIVHPDIVRQQIEGGLLWGAAAAIGVEGGWSQGLGTARALGRLGLPTLATAPEIRVELARSTEDPGGASELGVPAVAPAIANALASGSGRRFRRLPIRPNA